MAYCTDRIEIVNEATCDMVLRRILDSASNIKAQIHLANVGVVRIRIVMAACFKLLSCCSARTGITLQVIPGRPSFVLHGALQGLFMVAVMMVYLLVYRPIIRKMDATIKRSRSMLLLFPGEVVQSVAPIRDAMRDYAKSVLRGKARGKG